MLPQLEFAFERFAGDQEAPVGSYLNLRTLCITQLAADGVLPNSGIFLRVDPSATQTFANIATTINAAVGSAYTAASFHACAVGDTLPYPGTNVSDE